MTDGEPDAEAPPALVTRRGRLVLLIGDRRRSIVALAFCSSASALAESAILVLIAEIATSAAKGSTSTNSKLGFLHLHAKPDTLFLVAFALTLVRVGLQVPLATFPPASPRTCSRGCAENCSARSRARRGRFSPAIARGTSRRR